MQTAAPLFANQQPGATPPGPSGGALEHEARSCTSMGSGRIINEDVASIFPFVAPAGMWSGMVLALANGSETSPQGDVASAIAVDAIEDYVTAHAHLLDFTTTDWQEPLAEVLSAAYAHANAGVRRHFDASGALPAQGVALSVVVVVGDWICVAHAGDCRVYRPSMNGLEQLTADQSRRRPHADARRVRPVRALGYAVVVTPSLRFARLHVGDVVLLASRGLAGRIDGEELATLLRVRLPMAELARSIVAAADGREGSGDLTATVLRVSRLPGRRLAVPAAVAADADMSQPFRLPRHRGPDDRFWGSRRLSMLAVAIALAAGALAGWRHSTAILASGATRWRAAMHETPWLARWRALPARRVRIGEP